MQRVFLLHGWDGGPDNHWFPWLALELKARGFEVNAPQMPSAGKPRVLEWTGFLKEYVGRPNKDTYFVGHSLGSIAIARYLTELSPKVKVGGCVFVAGFSGRLNIPEIREFYSPPHQTQQKYDCSDNIRSGVQVFIEQKTEDSKVWCGGELPFDPEKAKQHCDHFVMIFSDNDFYVPLEKSLAFAKELGAKTILERGKKHFTAADGVTALPSALSALLKIASAERA